MSCSFGNAVFAQQLIALDPSQLALFAKKQADVANGRIAQQQPQQQQGRSTQQPSMPGSQNNPIEIVTPNLGTTSQLPTQPNIPSFVTPQQQLQPAAQITDQRFQQPQAQGRSRQTNATQQWVQQQQQPIRPPASPMLNLGQGQPKPWVGQDFTNEPFPMTEDQFWIYLGGQHLKRQEPMAAPVIDGKQVNLYALFNLVHKNGGSAKVGPSTWRVRPCLKPCSWGALRLGLCLVVI